MQPFFCDNSGDDAGELVVGVLLHVKSVHLKGSQHMNVRATGHHPVPRPRARLHRFDTRPVKHTTLVLMVVIVSKRQLTNIGVAHFRHEAEFHALAHVVQWDRIWTPLFTQQEEWCLAGWKHLAVYIRARCIRVRDAEGMRRSFGSGREHHLRMHRQERVTWVVQHGRRLRRHWPMRPVLLLMKGEEILSCFNV